MMVLADTCIWSAALRKKSGVNPHAAELTDLIDQGRLQIIGPIRQEVLSGIRTPAQYESLRDHLRAFSDWPLSTGDYEQAASYFNLCRSRGIQGSNTDFLICAVAVRTKMRVYTTDGDFKHYAVHLPIEFHEPTHR